MEEKFNVAHIGGRSGTIDFPKDTSFNDSINYSIFEADESCVEQIKRTNPFANIYPFCIDEKDGERDFYVNLNTYTSSFLKPNDTHLQYYIQQGDKKDKNKSDMLLNEMWKPIRTIKLKTYSLDTLTKTKKIPEINFLSLDAGGCEHDVLKGSLECLKKPLGFIPKII